MRTWCWRTRPATCSTAARTTVQHDQRVGARDAAGGDVLRARGGAGGGCERVCIPLRGGRRGPGRSGAAGGGSGAGGDGIRPGSVRRRSLRPPRARVHPVPARGANVSEGELDEHGLFLLLLLHRPGWRGRLGHVGNIDRGNDDGLVQRMELEAGQEIPDRPGGGGYRTRHPGVIRDCLESTTRTAHPDFRQYRMTTTRGVGKNARVIFTPDRERHPLRVAAERPLGRAPAPTRCR